VTAPGRSRQPSRKIAVHRVRSLNREDRTDVDLIPVTTVARTLLDLAEVVDPQRLERAFEEAERLRLLDLRAIESTCMRNPGRRGLKLLNALLPSLSPPAETRSELERRFIAFCREAGLPLPEVNVIVEGFEVDAFWRDSWLLVELDGYAFHRTRAAFERDRARDAALQVAGYRVLRITSRRLADEPAALAEAIRRLLART
jgi:hypothetical protein